MSVFKDEKQKTWEYRCYYKDFTGKRKQKHVRGFKTKKEAKAAESDFLKSLDLTNGYSNIKFSNLYEDYKNDKKGKLKDSTIVSNDHKIRKHILPYFKDKYIRDISVNDIRLWHNELSKNGKLSLTYLQSIHTRLSSILNYGMKYYGLPTNVASLNGNFTDSNFVKPEMDFYTYDEWKKFELALPDDGYKVFFQFLYWTGCRRGEAQALTWRDFENGFNYVRINKTLSSKVTGQSYQITPPKTVKSNRRISIPEVLKKALKEKYEHDQKIDGFSPVCFVFGITRPYSDETLRRRKNKACDKANLRRIRIHDFRHSHASFLFNNGIDVTVVSKRLGHADISVTMKTYIHMLPEKEDKAIEIMNGFK